MDETRKPTMMTEPRLTTRLSPRSSLRLQLAAQLFPALAAQGHSHSIVAGQALSAAEMLISRAEALEDE